MLCGGEIGYISSLRTREIRPDAEVWSLNIFLIFKKLKKNIDFSNNCGVDSGIWKTSVYILALSLAYCVILGKSPNFEKKRAREQEGGREMYQCINMYL